MAWRNWKIKLIHRLQSQAIGSREGQLDRNEFLRWLLHQQLWFDCLVHVSSWKTSRAWNFSNLKDQKRKNQELYYLLTFLMCYHVTVQMLSGVALQRTFRPMRFFSFPHASVGFEGSFFTIDFFTNATNKVHWLRGTSRLSLKKKIRLIDNKPKLYFFEITLPTTKGLMTRHFDILARDSSWRCRPLAQRPRPLGNATNQIQLCSRLMRTIAGWSIGWLNVLFDITHLMDWRTTYLCCRHGLQSVRQSVSHNQPRSMKVTFVL